MLLVAFALSSVMFVACNKYDDDIERIDGELAALNATVQSLKAAVDGGAVISSVSNTADGVKFTLSNGQSYTVNNGKDGAAGAAGKDGSVVTIGENGNWFIDGVDTEMPAEGKGEPGKSPRINEAGNWEVWDAATEAWVDTEVSAAGASTYVVENGAFYTLNVMEKDAEGNNLDWVSVNLPKTAAITSITSMNIWDWSTTVNGNRETYKDGIFDLSNAVYVDLNYGKTLDADLKFNGVSKFAKKGTTLIAKGAKVMALVNPMSVDASVYTFSLKDSKGNSPYILGTATPSMTEKPLTRAEVEKTPNKGVWVMPVVFASGVKFTDEAVAARKRIAYAITTETHEGTVASPYDVVINEKYVSNASVEIYGSIHDEGERTIDLSELFHNDDHVVAYYFEIDDQTKAAAIGAELNGDILTATKNGNIKINVNYLLVDGTVKEGDNAKQITAYFDYVAPTAELDPITWTISHKAANAYAYLPIDAIKASLIGSADGDIPSVSIKSITWADGDELDEKSVVINGAYYGAEVSGKTVTSIDNSWIVSSLNTTPQVWDNTNKVYVDATDINSALNVEFGFDYTVAMPGEYLVTLAFKKANSSQVALEVPVKVTIVAPSVEIVRHANYFTGNDAVAYGTPDYATGYATYTLNTLFKTASLNEADLLYFVESDTYGANEKKNAKWLQADGVTVNVTNYSYASTADYSKLLYAKREYTAVLVPYGNDHIEATTDVFNFTLKSAIKEGSFGSTASRTIETSDPVYFSVNDFNGVDVAGDKFYLGNAYTYDSTNGVYTNTAVAGTGKDARIYSISISAAADDTEEAANAANYLNIGTEFKVKGTPAADAFEVSRKSTVTRLAKDTPCKIRVRITDQWGVRSDAYVTVILKAFGN